MLRPEAPPGKAASPPATSPLWAVLTLTWLTSFGTAVAWAGIFFVTEKELDYSKEQNLALAAVLGLLYALVAYFATPITGIVVRAGRGPAPKRSARAVLALLLALSGLSALLPVLIPAEWSIWLFGFIYVPLTGLIWPGVESYVSSGRRGIELNRATGGFNLAWASAMMVAMWGMAALIEDNALWIIGSLAPLHAVALLLLTRFNQEPRAHGEAAHEHDPDQESLYRRLLRLARASLFFSYILHASLMPVIPQLMEGLGLAPAARPALASIWMTTRLVSFAVMQRWRAWHARRIVIAVAVALMILAYATSLLAPSTLILAIGLAFLGIGVGMTYAAAIYYALEVGTTDIDAGGKHEAMIGFGYTVGPVVALAIRSLFPSG